MAKKSLVAKQKRVAKFSARKYNRCKICGGRRSFMRKFSICRRCFRELAHKGELPGVMKSSW